VPLFSGKLSAVMTNLDDPALIGTATPPVAEERPMAAPAPAAALPREIGGRDGPEPTRFGDWELRGRCIDF
jgi:hypothetical protein